jgi:4-hydroxy-4-methyl-2-oxoglutarate aldolase
MPFQNPKLAERYERLSTPVVYDILDQMGYPAQALSSQIRPLALDMVVAGPAFTVEGRDFRPDQPSSVSSYQMFRDIVPGSVIVMAMNGHALSAPWGENSSITALMRGARGIVMEGGTRDVSATIALGFPTFCRYVTPVFAQGRYEITAYQQAVQMPGQLGAAVPVQPGDVVLADCDGVVIVPLSIAEEVLAAAERLEAIEGQIRAALRAGEDREEVYRRFPKFEHVRKIHTA